MVRRLAWLDHPCPGIPASQRQQHDERDRATVLRIGFLFDEAFLILQEADGENVEFLSRQIELDECSHVTFQDVRLSIDSKKTMPVLR